MHLLTAPPKPLQLSARAQTARVFSYGGGVQSNAVLVLQAQGKLRNPYDVFVFANVGADSENPETLEYVENVAKPFAAKHGIELVEVQKTTRGEPDTVVQALRRQQRSILIPVRMSHNGKPGNRNCTQTFKIEVVDKWISSHGTQFVTIGIGISLDEFGRMRDVHWHDPRRYGTFKRRRDYPLIDLRLKRKECAQAIIDAGLPLPPRSSCFFCPYKRPEEWIDLRRDDPPLFEIAADLETLTNERRALLGRDPVYFHPALVPLKQAVGVQPKLFPAWIYDRCDEGVCDV